MHFKTRHELNVNKHSVHLAEDAVGLTADVTREYVHVVFEDAPAGAVGRLAVVTVLTARLCDVQPQFEKLLVLVLREKLVGNSGVWCVYEVHRNNSRLNNTAFMILLI